MGVSFYNTKLIFFRFFPAQFLHCGSWQGLVKKLHFIFYDAPYWWESDSLSHIPQNKFLCSHTAREDKAPKHCQIDPVPVKPDISSEILKTNFFCLPFTLQKGLLHVKITFTGFLSGFERQRNRRRWSKVFARFCCRACAVLRLRVFLEIG